MKATEILSLLKKIIKGLIIINVTLILAIIIIVCSFLHYLSLYDFVGNDTQSVENIETMSNSSIEQHK